MRLLLPLLAAALICAADEPPIGASRHLACDGDAALTYDLYLPKAYGGQAGERLPVLFISSPGGNPGFQGLEPWAERQEVVLVAINDSRNGPWEPIHAAQKAVAATVFAHLRLHHCLRFSTGFSGAAWASAVLAEKHGDDWAGILFCGNSQRGTALKKHVACAYITGEKDTTYAPSLVLADYQGAKGAGNPARFQQIAGMGHQDPPVADRIAMLDWMIGLERLTNPRLTPDEVKAGLARLHQQVEALAQEADPAKRCVAAEGMLAADVVARSKDGQALKALWCAAMIAQADGETEPVRQFRRLQELATSDRITSMPAPERRTVQSRMAKLLKDKAVKADSDSRAALAQVAAAEARSNGSKQQTQGLIANYQAIAKRWPDSEAGKDAAAAAERLLGK